MESLRNSSELRFSKMHGAGNDFVLLDLRNADPPSPEVCRALADRHTGVGCDMILGVQAPRSAEAVASFDIRTAEGAPSRQCGNGARCIAAWLLREGLAAGPRFALDSPSGTHTVEVLDEYTFTVDMGTPRFVADHRRGPGVGEAHEVDLDDGPRLRFTAVRLGNPHAVVEVADVDTAPVAGAGSALQRSPLSPPTVNVGFAEVVTRDHVRLRVYEYGAGETRSCGSGACAAVAALIRRGLLDGAVSVSLPGGELHVNWPDPAAPVLLTGPAAFVYEGRFPHAYP
ncbi:diaminopimelate epimerase [Actinopolyspora mortivallis]|uniref:diaminopimelate epimerase n=1 Tax=Actinopolyspora mortivallis TaxID=33906 RepID=UPI0003A79B01|nr:diaminopimelate epimerase [Actinopolyspora mortivallis]